MAKLRFSFILMVFVCACTDIKKPDMRIKKDDGAANVVSTNGALTLLNLTSLDHNTAKFDLNFYNYDSNKGLSFDTKNSPPPEETSKVSVNFSGTSLDQVSVQLLIGDQETNSVVKLGEPGIRQVISFAAGNSLLRLFFVRTTERVKVYAVSFPVSKKPFSFGLGLLFTTAIYNQQLSIVSVAGSKQALNNVSESRTFDDENDFSKPSELIKL
jgi:hypothetical protein